MDMEKEITNMKQELDSLKAIIVKLEEDLKKVSVIDQSKEKQETTQFPER